MEEYLEYVKDAPYWIVSCKLHSGRLFVELGGYARRVGHGNVLIVGLVKSQLNMFFLSMYVSYNSQ